MSIDTAKKAVDIALSATLAASRRHIDISFFGGEPMLRMGLIREIVEYCEHEVQESGRKITQRYIMNTNGTLMNDDSIEFMSKPRTFVTFISLDGDRETHDQFRVNAAGKGSYDDVMDGVRQLRNAGIPYQLVGVVNVATAAALGRTVRNLAAESIDKKLVLATNYRDDWTDASIEVLRRGLNDAGDVWMDMFRNGRKLIVEPLHSKILTHLKGGIPCPGRCQLAGSEMCVAPSGNIYPCAQMVGEDNDDTLVIGHVDTGLDLDKLRLMQLQKDMSEAKCAPCDLRTRCQSHCGCTHVAVSGKLGDITGVLCELESAYIDAADRVAEQLYLEGCPAFMQFYYEKRWVPALGGVLTELRRSRDG